MKRFVSYIYSISNNRKINNCGFARIELRTGRNRVDIHLKDHLNSGKKGTVYLFLRNGSAIQGILLGEFVFKEDKADFRYERAEDKVGGTPYRIDQLQGLLLMIDEQIVYMSQWDEKPVDLSQFVLWESGEEKTEINIEAEKTREAESQKNKNTVNTAAEQQKVTVKAAVEQHKSTVNAATEQQKVTVKAAVEQHKNAENAAVDKAPINKLQNNKVKRNTIVNQSRNNNAQERLVINQSRNNNTQERSAINQPRNQEMTKNTTVNQSQYQEKQKNAAINDVQENNTKEELEMKTAVPQQIKSSNMKEQQNIISEDIKKEASKESVQKTENASVITAEIQPQAQASDSAWEQNWRYLIRTYPVLNEFADEEHVLCVRVELKDIRLLPQKYWGVMNNSFLLHGFFNYRYLVIGRKEQSWFLGIPGVFQSQEHVMASIFGFPEFLAQEQPTPQGERMGYWYRILEP